MALTLNPPLADLAADAASALRENFGVQAALTAAAPGRVNLIGEHIDYEGYAVLPMALSQDCCVAIRSYERHSEHSCDNPCSSSSYCSQVEGPAVTDASLTASSSGSVLIQLASMQHDKYPAVGLDVDPHQGVNTHQHSWSNYLLAAYKGAFQHMTANNHHVTPKGSTTTHAKC